MTIEPAPTITPRQRVNTALAHQTPDRVPVDFLATNEIWQRLIERLQPDAATVGASDYFDPQREALLRQLAVDCRVISYDMFCDPPESMLQPGATIEWWDVLSRSTPCRMWRQRLPDGEFLDILGRRTRVVENPTGAYEESAGYPLAAAQTLADLQAFAWPDPDWWDFDAVPALLDQLQPYHMRFRIGSVFEVAWQLRGMEQFFMDMAMSPDLPRYIMDRLTDLYVENTRRLLAQVGDRLDMVYFYDDVASQQNLLMSRSMWESFIRPCHARIIDAVKPYGAKIMYHSDGAMRALIPDLIELGVDVLNPVQADAKGMEPEGLKADFGDRLCFHGGIDIIKTLPQGTPGEVQHEVRERIRVLGQNGGYILASSHHIQSDTPIENVFAMYDVSLRTL